MVLVELVFLLKVLKFSTYFILFKGRVGGGGGGVRDRLLSLEQNITPSIQKFTS